MAANRAAIVDRDALETAFEFVSSGARSENSVMHGGGRLVPFTNNRTCSSGPSSPRKPGGHALGVARIT
jgi:hypothetical protein